MTDIATITQAVAIVSACWVVISGVGAWKREFIGRRRIELAEQTLAKFFEVRDAITFIRNPFSSSEEGKSRERSDNELSTHTELLDRGYIVVERYTKRETTFAEFNTLKYRFMAAFGPDTESIFTDTMKAVNSIFVSARMLAKHYWRRQGTVAMSDVDFNKHLEEMYQHEGVFWDTITEDDIIRLQLRTIQARLEEVTAPCFKEPIKLYSVLTKPWK